MSLNVTELALRNKLNPSSSTPNSKSPKMRLYLPQIQSSDAHFCTNQKGQGSRSVVQKPFPWPFRWGVHSHKKELRKCNDCPSHIQSNCCPKVQFEKLDTSEGDPPRFYFSPIGAVRGPLPAGVICPHLSPCQGCVFLCPALMLPC